MKRLLTPNLLHLAEVLNQVIAIEICDNVEYYPCTIAASENIYDDLGNWLPNDKDYMYYSDEQLLNMYNTSEGRVLMEALTDGEVLDRLYRICPQNLTALQTQLVSKYYESADLIVDDTDIEDLLSKIRKCDYLEVNIRHPRTRKFVLDANGHIRYNDCLDVIHKLSLEDHCEDMYSADPKFRGDKLLVFRPRVNWVTSSGELIDDIKLYLKIDLDRTTGQCVVLVSFHIADYDDEESADYRG